MLAGGAEREPDTPGEPVGTRGEAIAPASASVELTNEIEQPRGRGIEMCGELGDLVAEPLELNVIRVSRNEALTIDVHRDSPCADFNLRFLRALEGARRRDRAVTPNFFDSRESECVVASACAAEERFSDRPRIDTRGARTGLSRVKNQIHAAAAANR